MSFQLTNTSMYEHAKQGDRTWFMPTEQLDYRGCLVLQMPLHMLNEQNALLL